jgi:hypothetical protein
VVTTVIIRWPYPPTEKDHETGASWATHPNTKISLNRDLDQALAVTLPLELPVVILIAPPGQPSGTVGVIRAVVFKSRATENPVKCV